LLLLLLFAYPKSNSKTTEIKAINLFLKSSFQFIAETRLTSKELPTTKWRRERRQRAAAADYQVHDAGSGLAERERERERTPDMDSPIDMSVTSSTVKHQRASPPPPYREPLAGATSHCYGASRPSVITQAPPKREPQEHLHSHSHSSREQENRSSGRKLIAYL